jgi:hypothetical protein
MQKRLSVRFAAFTDAQLEALRRLSSVALTASPDLAHGEALELTALADAEALGRGHLRQREATRASVPVTPIAPHDLVAGLASAVASVRPETTNTTKWAQVSVVLSRALALVKPGNSQEQAQWTSHARGRWFETTRAHQEDDRLTE